MLNTTCAFTQVATGYCAGVQANASPNSISAVLAPDDILLDLDVPSKNLVLQEISRFVSARHGLSGEQVYASLVQREAIGSTALGCGIAIPHARLKGLSRLIAAFVRTEIAVPFDAPDGKPVSDLFVLLVPNDATNAYLPLLAEVAEMFGDVSFRDGLRTCAQADDVYACIAMWRPQ